MSSVLEKFVAEIPNGKFNFMVRDGDAWTNVSTTAKFMREHCLYQRGRHCRSPEAREIAFPISCAPSRGCAGFPQMEVGQRRSSE
ncbi:MAG: hypothetical protein ABID04_04350 [Patescibacteria group bacterium]